MTCKLGVCLKLATVALAVSGVMASHASDSNHYEFNAFIDFTDPNDEATYDELDIWLDDLSPPVPAIRALIAIQHIEGMTPNTDIAKVGMSAQFSSLVNTGDIHLSEQQSVSIEANAGVKLRLPNMSEINGKNWMYVVERPGNPAAIVPSAIASGLHNVKIFQIGMLTLQGEAANAGTIAVDVSFDAKLSATSVWDFDTDNVAPTQEELDATLGDKNLCDWDLTPEVRSVARVDAQIQAVGMQAVGSFLGHASAVNSGTIDIGAFITRTDETHKEINWGSVQSDIHMSKTGNSNVTLDVTRDESNITAETHMSGNALAAGMYATTLDLKPEVPEENPEAPEENPEGEIARINDSCLDCGDLVEIVDPIHVDLINTGTIRIAASKEFTAVGMAAVAQNNDIISMTNLGTIDLTKAQGNFVHQLYAEIEDAGQVEVGDWLLHLGMQENEKGNHITPFAIRMAENATGGLSFKEGASLILVPGKASDLDNPVSLGTMVAQYDANGNPMTDTPNITGQFDTIRTGSRMLSVSSDTSQGFNNISVTFDVHPEKALGTDVRSMAMGSNVNALMTLRGLTAQTDFAKAEGWHWQAMPWYVNADTDSRNGYEAKGGGAVLQGAVTWGETKDWNASGYFAVAHENLTADSNAASGSSTKVGLGLALKRQFGEITHVGARFDYGFDDTDWQLVDNLGRDKAGADSDYWYAEVNAGIEWPIADDHLIGAGVAFGWLHLKQDGFTSTTLGTGSVRYDDETLETGVATLEAHWKGKFEVAGFDIAPTVSIAGTYFTDNGFETSFSYLDHRYSAKDEVSDFLTTATVGVGFGKDNMTMSVYGSQRWGSDYSAQSVNARVSWRF
ncbi:MAG: autotransporter outer membrane beta-barrel domain-containing protein [Sutterellaceae bacterium]|nr:autotransporter outer membrane beta-barrel domain-containing protein [Sutterellaceae bacterium]